MNTEDSAAWCKSKLRKDVNDSDTEMFEETVPLDASWFATSPFRAVIL